MSRFVKDLDAHTRGVNAIAAVDGAGTRLRRKEAMKARAMMDRDARMAAMAGAAFKPLRHSLANLGAIPMANRFTSRLDSQQITMTTGLVVPMTDVTPPRPPGGGGLPPSNNPTSTPPRRPPLNAGSDPTIASWGTPSRGVTPAPRRPSGGLSTGGGTTRPGQVGPGTAADTSIVTGGSAGSGSSGTSSSGSGASSATSGGGYGTIPVDEEALDELNMTPSTPVTMPMSRNTKLLLLAAIAAGGYWLYKRNG